MPKNALFLQQNSKNRQELGVDPSETLAPGGWAPFRFCWLENV